MGIYIYIYIYINIYNDCTNLIKFVASKLAIWAEGHA